MSPETKRCAYEAVMDDSVQRCAVGCLLTPSTLAQTLDFTEEGTSEGQYGIIPLARFQGSLTQLSEHGYYMPELDGVENAFLEGAQVLHDSQAHWEDGKFKVEMLDALAFDFGLVEVQDEKQGAPREGVLIA